MDPQLIPVYERLKQIRALEKIEPKPSKHLKETFTGFDGVERPLTLRTYQVKGVAHLMAMPRFLLGDDCGLGKCKPLNSLVLTDRGLLRLGSLGPTGNFPEESFHAPVLPTKVWTGFASGWQPIQQYYYGGTKPIIRVTTRRGYQTEGTLVHPLWVRTPQGVEKFVEMQNLSVGDVLVLDRSATAFPNQEPALPIPSKDGFYAHAREYAVPSTLSPDLACLLGYIVAEAWCNSKQSIIITQHLEYNPEIYQHIVELCSRILHRQLGSAKDIDTTIAINSVFIRDYLLKLGIEAVLSADKTVPWPIFQGTRESVIGFLRGYFDGECSVSAEVLEVSSASKVLLQEVQQLLLRLGILSSLRPKEAKGRIYWRLALCGEDAVHFHTQIGLRTPRKQAALAELVSQNRNPNLDVVPYVRGVVDRVRGFLLKQTSTKGANAERLGTGLKQFGQKFISQLGNIRNNGVSPSFACLSDILQVCDIVGIPKEGPYLELRCLLEQHSFYDPIVNIEYLAPAPVADIEVAHADHSFVADGFINHNTLSSIAALAYLWDKNPEQKAIVFTNKSAIGQWHDEFRKFAVPTINLVVALGTPKQRQKAYAQFEAHTGPTVLIMGYRTAVQDFSLMQNWLHYILLLDEATAFKTPGTQVSQVVGNFSKRASRAWGFSATLLKNHLMEGYGIYQVLVPGLFPTNKNNFMMEYCIIKLQSIRGSNRQIPIIMGYRNEDIQKFKDMIDPFYLGRPKHEVATELPVLTVKNLEVALTMQQNAKYAEALSGLLTLGEGVKTEERETTELTQLIYCQQIVDDLDLIGISGADSPKLDALVDLLTEGEFAEDKVIVYSRFKKMVNLAEGYLRSKGIESVRITGDEDTQQRREAAKRFQDPNDKVRVCFITNAGAEAVNLQAARALIFYDSPWSAGDMLQILGRMIRIGSTHESVYAIHLVASGTIDEHVLKILKKKMVLIESVLGKRLKTTDAVSPQEAVKEPAMVSVTSDTKELYYSMLDSAREQAKK